MSAVNPPRRLPGLDLIRLLATVPVVCYHFCIESARAGFAVPAACIGRPMADVVEVSLALFFLLSGASLCLRWRGRFALRPYLVGRAAGIYPMFWLGWGALFVYGEVLHGASPGVPRWRAVFSVLGVDGYLAAVTPTFYKIGEWFLGVILLLYLLFPALLAALERPRLRLALGAGLALLAAVWPLVCPAPWEAGHTVLGRLPAFALGVWFGAVLPGGPRAPGGSRLPFLAAAAAVVLLPLPRLCGQLAVAAVLFWPLLRAGERLPAPVRRAVQALAGECYGVYLVHHVFLTLVVLPLTVRLALPLPAVLLPYLAASFAGAAVLRRLAAPLAKLLRRLAA